MKQRMTISIIISALIIITLPFAFTLFEIQWKSIFLIFSLITLAYIGIFIFGGLPELIIFGIYGGLTALALRLINIDYQIPIIVIATLIFLLNPLSSFESYLRKQMKDENTQPIQISIRGNRWPFFAYRKEMKNYYHLPQSRKLYTIQSYKYLRQFLMLALIGIGIFSFIHEVNHIANTLDNFNWTNFVTLYIIVMIFLLAYFLYLKGFTSTFRTFAISLFPLIIYIISVSTFDNVIKISMMIGFIIFTLVIITIELYRLHQRVIYDALTYYDVDMQKDVYANALFEPIVYNETYTLCSEYLIKTDKTTFDLHFHDILVYANFFHFIIVAYTINQTEVTLHVHFYYKDHRRVDKFKSFLETKFQRSIPVHTFSDFSKTDYEKNFFHKDSYIIARAQHLAYLLKELQIHSKIIISIIVYFDKLKDFEAFNNVHDSVQLNDIVIENYVSARVDCICVNNRYVIETKLREILINLMIYHGKFVRLNVYY